MNKKLKKHQKQRRLRQALTWMGLPLVAILGWFYPLLGFLLLGCMVGAVGIALYRGRAWCDWMCPRGAFYDLFIAPLSRHRKVPVLLRQPAVRVFMLLLIFTMIGIQWYAAAGNVRAMGLALVRILTVTTVVGIILGLVYHQRTWCHICPMGTLGSWLARGKKPLAIKPTCTACGACSRVCPMQLKPFENRSLESIADPDCIKCGTCAAACPRRAISSQVTGEEKRGQAEAA